MKDKNLIFRDKVFLYKTGRHLGTLLPQDGGSLVFNMSLTSYEYTLLTHVSMHGCLSQIEADLTGHLEGQVIQQTGDPKSVIT